MWRQIIVTGAISSTVQVCMICLDTDSRLILMSKHKLEETYEKLTGHPITLQHIKMINCTKYQLKSSMVLTMPLIQEHPSEDRQIQKPRKKEEENRQTVLEETGQRVVVKTEESDVSMLVDGDTEVLHEHNNDKDSVWDPLKYESITFQCTLCMEEFVHENAYIQHVCVHLQNGEGDGECHTSQVCKPHTAVSSSFSHSSLITENKQADPSPSAQAAQTSVVAPSANLVTNDKINPTEEVDTNVSCRYKRLTDCFVKLNDIFAKKNFQIQDGSLMKTRRGAMSRDSLNGVSKDFSHQATSRNELPTTEYIEPVTNSSGRVKVIVSNTFPSNTYCSNNVINIQCINSSLRSSETENISFICDICGKNYKQKSLLVIHIKTHSGVRRFACKICQYKCKCKRYLAQHMITHSGEKPFACNICNSKFARSSHLVYHMSIHTGIKPYACELCEYRCAQKSDLVRHMRIHTGDKLYYYSCEICEYKCSDKSNLVRHMRTHTGEKPFTCKICNSKFADSSNLVYHMSTHTGIKPYACKLCEYRSAQKSSLVRHMRIHTGEKLYSCQICEYKCSDKSNLVRHMRTHTGEKPYSCQICEYKCSDKRCLVRHMRTHR